MTEPREITMEVVSPNPHPCSACGGSGSQWAKRKDGQPDLRHVSPIGPCPVCRGKGSS